MWCAALLNHCHIKVVLVVQEREDHFLSQFHMSIVTWNRSGWESYAMETKEKFDAWFSIQSWRHRETSCVFVFVSVSETILYGWNLQQYDYFRSKSSSDQDDTNSGACSNSDLDNTLWRSVKMQNIVSRKINPFATALKETWLWHLHISSAWQLPSWGYMHCHCSQGSCVWY